MTEDPSADWQRPFSNGSEWRGWVERNCGQCAKSSPDPSDIAQDVCDLEGRILDEGEMYSKWAPETWARVGVPDDLGYPPKCGEFEAIA